VASGPEMSFTDIGGCFSVRGGEIRREGESPAGAERSGGAGKYGGAGTGT